MSVVWELTRAAIIVRQPLLAKVFCDLLTRENMQIVANHRAVSEANLKDIQPALLLLDLDACEKNVGKTLRQCRHDAPACRICVLVSSVDDPQIRVCIDERVDGLVASDVPLDEILQVVRTVASGGCFVDRRIARNFLRSRNALTHQQDQLSNREEEIVQMIVRGLANKEIADYLHLSQSTVKNHISRIFEKLSVTSRTEAAIFVVKGGLL